MLYREGVIRLSMGLHIILQVRTKVSERHLIRRLRRDLGLWRGRGAFLLLRRCQCWEVVVERELMCILALCRDLWGLEC